MAFGTGLQYSFSEASLYYVARLAFFTQEDMQLGLLRKTGLSFAQNLRRKEDKTQKILNYMLVWHCADSQLLIKCTWAEPVRTFIWLCRAPSTFFSVRLIGASPTTVPSISAGVILCTSMLS